ncbi:MAG TPA: hypothetical protein VK118_05610 [Tetragenococcus sp.]|nr:hypothetical protein [Tetragenococcus sp.]
MGKSNLKKTGVLIAAVAALGICAVGYQLSSHKQYQQRVAYAKSSASQEKQKLTTLQKQIDTFYQDKKAKQFIKEDVKAADVTKTKAEVDSIKTTAEDFQIKEKSLPANVDSLTTQKKQLNDEILDVLDKLNLQDKTSGLFTKEISSWQKFDDSVVIKDKLTANQVGDITDELGFFAKGDWKKMIQAYLSEAGDQLEQVEKVQKKIKKYQKNTITYEQYLTLSSQIDQIKNKKIRESFDKDMDKFSDRIGLGAEEQEEADTAADTDTDTNADTDVNAETETDTATDENTETDANTDEDTGAATEDQTADQTAGLY